MNQSETYLHQLIRSAVTRRPEHLLEDAQQLWQHLCQELVPIIGSGGFSALYQRSLALAGQEFPWIVATNQNVNVQGSFHELNVHLSQRSPGEATEALVTVMTIFVDVLAKLIGSSLTTRILSSAWGDDVFPLSDLSDLSDPSDPSVPESQK